MNSPFKRSRIVALAILALLFIIVFFALRNCGNYLVVDNARKSDVILVPSRGLQLRYDRGIYLLKDGYAEHMIADVPAIKYFGNSAPELAQKYFDQQPDVAGKIDICVIKINLSESLQAAKCLEKFKPKSVLIIAGEFETRRALKDYSHYLPQYEWSVTPAEPNPQYPIRWWRNKDQARIVYLEWTQLLWWEIFGR
ncbi:MAG TPA: hypothetical protein VK738_20670 [Terriglobales bacterium]|jgi:hypothetical protein|nr:hypothetical protein [Terriglobales bacterium]